MMKPFQYLNEDGTAQDVIIGAWENAPLLARQKNRN
jgi:hypothetical protein